MQTPLSPDQLPSFATDFWKLANGYRVFAFHGEMGAGKTTLISALCHAKGVKDAIGSPTFSIINQYVYEENDQQKKIFHIDLYRLKDEEEIVQAGVEDCVYSDAITLVEWPEKAPDLFDENTVHIYINAINDSQRSLKIALPAARMQEQS